MRLPARAGGKLVHKFLALVFALLLSIGVARADNLVASAALNIPNLDKVDANFYRGGMPNEQGFEQLRAAGVKTIVSLANEKKYRDAERATAQRLGMKFVHIPLSPWREPTQNDIDAFLAVVNDKQDGPIFVHCLHGEDRTGAMVAIYRMQQGWTEQAAYDEMLKKGFHRIFLNLSESVRDFSKHEG
jgi:tyrosine-protein phosphatase SIW14